MNDVQGEKSDNSGGSVGRVSLNLEIPGSGRSNISGGNYPLYVELSNVLRQYL